MILVMADNVIRKIKAYLLRNSCVNISEELMPVINASMNPVDKAVLNKALSRTHLVKLASIIIQKMKKPGPEKNSEIKKITTRLPARSPGWYPVTARNIPHNKPLMNADNSHIVNVINDNLTYCFISWYSIEVFYSCDSLSIGE